MYTLTINQLKKFLSAGFIFIALCLGSQESYAASTRICNPNGSSWTVDGVAKDYTTYIVPFVTNNNLVAKTKVSLWCYDYDTVVNNEYVCVSPNTQAPLPFPSGYYVSEIRNAINVAPQCRIASEGYVRAVAKLTAYPASTNTTVQACLYPYTWQTTPTSWVMGTMANSAASNCMVDGSTLAYPTVNINGAGVANAVWCQSNGNPGTQSYVQVDSNAIGLIAGYYADEQTTHTACQSLTPYVSIQRQYTLKAIGSATSLDICADKYAVAGGMIPSGFVATYTYDPTGHCEIIPGETEAYFHIIKPTASSVTPVCAAHMASTPIASWSYYAPAGYVITSKQLDSRCYSGFNTWSYTITKPTGAMTGVCPESFSGSVLPNGYIWYGGSVVTNCDIHIRPINAGETSVDACFINGNTLPTNWIPVAVASSSISCGGTAGAYPMNLQPASSGAIIMAKIRPMSPFPSGYVIVPGNTSCSSGYLCYKIDLASNATYVCSDTLLPVAGYQTNGDRIVDSGCSIGGGTGYKYAFGPTPPPSPVSPPAALNATETDIPAKPASMPAITY